MFSARASIAALSKAFVTVLFSLPLRLCTPTSCISAPHLPCPIERSYRRRHPINWKSANARVESNFRRRSVPSLPVPQYGRIPQAHRPAVHVFLLPRHSEQHTLYHLTPSAQVRSARPMA
ncbi:uncharacterized protein EDB91DRAFT_1149511 [Suillus paluster]|uniref:uncharacterized protein n=1 Tax=Suillus paluster TaxID=48578 RepID=UPI001B86D6D7|nr:uncharacterized protein EDB91DRAFT_1149511 [Suillus paluster]KAG1733214.1 hypothetical protein EDB91DRAFT_1149511 [Suillus paluster]